ncbi:hypothetical protein [Aquabacterium sp.]|nr:hypothetical protein [Aquabacterium sp.]MBC7699680.1 hypothetical protein [Aquabacterium sp.]
MFAVELYEAANTAVLWFVQDVMPPSVTEYQRSINVVFTDKLIERLL